jgi:fimbrial isopeptide formation D2 family protein/uncharacterized repeat protein (TIGR01451 family)
MAPSPTVALGPSSLDLLYGTSGNLQLTFDESSGTGFQPWLELQVAAPSSHLSFGAASWASIPIATKSYTFTRSGTSGPYTLVHPITGATLTSATPDTLLICQLPVGSYVASAPALVVSVPVSVKATSPMLGPVPLRAGGGYALGADPLNNPLTDPPISAPNVTGQVVPSPLTFSKSNNLAESETATGPNFIGAWRLSADIADGVQLNKLVVSDTLPNDLNLLEINPSLKLTGTLTQQPVGNPTATGNNQIVINYGGPTTGTTSPEEAAAQINFYVPNTLDPTTGGAITYTNTATATTSWANAPSGSVNLNIAASDTITARALAIQKAASTSQVVPGGSVSFTLNFQISDYFAFGDLIVKDLLGDGLTYTPGSARINLQEQGVSLTGNGSAAFDPAYINYLPDVAGPGVDGKDSLSFNLSGWLKSVGDEGILQGGRVNSSTAGATRGTITFTASVDDTFTAPKAAGQNIKAGDKLGNDVTLQGDIQKPLLGGFTDTNRLVSDTSSVGLSVVDIGFTKTAVARNGQALGSNAPVLTPGDTITYRIQTNFPTGDIQGFKLADFLPTPIFDVDKEASGGSSSTAFELFSSNATVSNPSSLPPTGFFSYGSLNTAPSLVDNQLKTGAAVNDLVATIANTSDSGNSPKVLDLYYTVTVTGAAIADRLPLTNIASASTVDSSGVSRPIQISAVTGEVLAPSLKIRKGIVVTSRDSLTGNQKATYTPGLNTGGGTFPAALGAAPFTGTISSSSISVAGGNGSIGAVKNNALDSNVTGLDAGDSVRFVIVIENIGTSYRGAFNVQLRDELPAGLTFTSGSLRIVDGSGAALSFTRPDGTAASDADIFTAAGIRLTDPGSTPADADGVGGGAIDGYNAASGRNIAVVSFDASVDNDAYSRLVSGNLTNVGVLEDFTNVPSGGASYLPGSAKLSDNATIALRNAAVSKSIVATSESSTSGNNVAIGEIVRYRLQVTVPEGNLANFKLVDALPTGLSFLNDGTASAPIFSAGVSSSLSPLTPTISGSSLTWDLGTLTNGDRDNTIDDTIALEFNALVTNSSGNTNGTTRRNTGTVSYTGGSATGNTDVRISEPAITISKAVSPTSNVQAGDTLTYTVTVSNAANRADAFDLVLNDVLGNLGSNFDLQSINLPGSLPSGTGSITNTSTTSAASAAAGDLIQLSIDRLNSGQSFSFTYTGVVLTSIEPSTTLTNTANVIYTGLPGTGTPNGSGGNSTGSTTPGASGTATGERDGSGGSLNNYAKSASQSVVSQALDAIKSTRLTSEAHTSGNDVVIGEIVRYRLKTDLPQGTVGKATMRDVLPSGLTFLADNTAKLAFVAANAADLSWNQGVIDPYYLPSIGNNNTVIPTASYAPTIAGQTLSWDLGELVNRNTDPTQIESVLIEFNALVANVAGNQAGTTITNSFIASAGLNGAVAESTSSAPPLLVREPLLQTDKTAVLQKTGASGNANPTPGDTLVYTVVIRNTGTAKAFNLSVDDNLDALGINFDLSGAPTVVQSQPAAPAVIDTSIFNGSNGLSDRIQLEVPELDINQTVTITYQGVLAATLPPGTALSNSASVSYTSLPGTGTANGSDGNSTGSSTPGASGAANGERNGSDGPGALNDYLSSKTLILVANRPPVAVNDTGAAIEAGGRFNSVAGSNANGNLLSNDSDPDPADNPLTLKGTLTGIRTGASEGAGSAGSLGSPLWGIYGQLIVNADGSFTYSIDNNHPIVDALDPGASLSESFNYTVSDGALSDIGLLTITIQGVNDAPVADDDNGVSIEAGGTLNGTPGADGSGNVISNDRDVDNADGNNLVAPPQGKVLSFRTGGNEGSGTTGNLGAALKGLYGSLTLNADGSYHYVLDNSNPTVDALNPGDTLTELFNYTLLDHPGGLSDTAVLTLTILGSNDAPVAFNDVGAAIEAGGTLNGTPGANASGNVLVNDTDVDSKDTPLPGKGTLTAIRSGATEGSGTPGTPDGNGGFLLVGTYGSLSISANGTYTYTLNNANPEVDGMDAGDQLIETFNYTVSDTGSLTDTAVLTITITGRNDAPVASDDSGSALEAGGVANGTGGADATGDVLNNDNDVDRSDTPAINGTITAIRLGGVEGAGSAGTVGAALQGLYGSLTIQTDGSYRYVIDNANPTVDALNPGDRLSESFNYTVRDIGGLTDTAVLTITILGSNDAPVASNDIGIAKEAGGINNSSGGANASGNVLTNDTDVDSNDKPLPSKGTVTAIRAGREEGSGAAGSVGNAIKGQYGSLLINANGSFTYVVNDSDLTVERLNQGDSRTEFFNYTVLDHSGGLTDMAVLAITVEGTNDNPKASDDYIGRMTSGQSGTIRVIANDTDIDSRLVPNTIKIEGTANPGVPLVVPGQGTWSVDPGNGDITFTPNPGFTTNPTPIKYTIQDEQGATSNPATVYINYDSPSVGPEPPIPVTDASPVNLFLLLDNSTSMQGLDPTGVTRLEAQNRIAFYYCLKPVFNNAGYIFKKGDQFGFNGDVTLTPSQNLATEILSWELIDNPFDNKTAQTVTIHTIDFSYLVTHTKTVINSSTTAEGVTLASDVLATTTPDKQYGSSTSADWIARGLPAPGNLDAYTAPGTPGNRYSGTEMLGALTALKDLLNDEITSVTTDTRTYVGLITDGRPERRPWWDNRPEFGQGWSGVNVALPTDADLGGDPIISSGLRYLSNGTPIKVPTANGVDIWGQNQRELNAALDRTAAASGSPDSVKVISVGLGDGGISNWSAIYSDLFNNQTFNNQVGGWGYQIVTPNIQLQS